MVGAVLALAAVGPGPARAGTYTFSFQESIVDARLQGPAVHGTFAALRDTSTAIAGWHGPRVRTTAGGHTAGSFAMLDLVAPSPAKFVQSSVVVRYRGCSKEAAAGFWIEASAIVGQSEALGTRRTLPPFDGCTEVAAEHPGSGTIARPDRIRFKLGSTRTDASHAAGTSLLINQITGTIEDVTAPAVTALGATGTTTGAARVVTWSAADGQAGPRSVTLRVTGPNGFVLVPAGWSGMTTANRACLAGQFMSGCQTTVSGAAAITLPAATGTYAATVTVTDGAGNVGVRSLDLARVAAPTVASAPSLGGAAQVGQTLTLAGGTFGNGPTAVTYSFHRLAGGTLTPVQTAGASRSYVVGRADHGSTIVGRVTGSNGAGSALVDSPASAVVLPGRPAGGTPVVDGQPAIVDHQLAVVPGTWDNGGAPGSPAVVAVRWYSCATACALVGHAATYTPGAADLGRRLMAEVDVVNAAGTTTGATARTGVVTAGPPTLVAAPVVSGPARVGETLSALPAVATGHGAPVTVVLSWLTCRGPGIASCSGAAGVGATHPVTEAERGLRMRVRADVRSAGGSIVSWSAPTEPVQGRNECLLVAPGTITACIGASSRITLEASLDRSRAAAGQPVVVRGRITVAGDLLRPDRVTVVRGGRAQPVAVDAGGGYALTFVPALSERVSVSVSIPGRGDALALDAGEVRVVPRMTARFTVRRDRFGTGRDLRVTGRVVPRVPVSKFRLLLEGRTPKGRVVGLICRVDEQPVVLDGSYAAHCKSRGLPRLATYRVRFLPGPNSPLEPAQTGWQRAALRRSRTHRARTARLLAAPRSL